MLDQNRASLRTEKELLIQLSTLTEVIGTFRLDTLTKELSVINKYTTSNEFIDVVVLGQFKSGKSSFINSIIGEDILPVGVIPVTSIVTRLQYGAALETRVHFLDGRFTDISINEIEQLITEEHNSKNVKNVALVDVFVPHLYGYNNIRIVDTPGVGSFFKHNTETTNQWLPEIGVALIAVSVERPLSEDDILLIKNIKKHAAQTDIIITKSDLVTEKQLEQVLNYINKILAGENLNDCLLLPYSTRTETAARSSEIKEKVLAPLSENFTEKFRDIFRHKINALRQSCLSYLRLGLEFSNKKGNEKEELRKTVLDERLKLSYINKELIILTTAFKESNREKVKSILTPYTQDIAERLKIDFDDKYNSWRLNLHKLSRNFEAWLESELTILLQKCYEQAELNLDNYIQDIQQHYYQFANSFIERLNDNVNKTLGVKINSILLQINRGKINQPDINVSYSFDIQIDLIWFLIPMFIFRPLFRKFFWNKIPFEVGKNVSRLISDVNESINKVIDYNKNQVTQFISNELATIERLLGNQENESDHYKEAIDRIEKLISL